MRVLLIVDVQNDFCPGGNLAVSEGDQIVPVINKMMSEGEFDLIVASKDWHPANHISFAVSHSGKKVFDMIDVNGLSQCLWPVHCIENSFGAELHPGLDKSQINRFILKGSDPNRDSYSAFFDNDHSSSTKLMEMLDMEARQRHEEVNQIELTVCGLATDYCVKFTALDARLLGLKTDLVVDACRAVNATQRDDERALREMQNAGVSIIESWEVTGLREVAHPRPFIDAPMERGALAQDIAV